MAENSNDNDTVTISVSKSDLKTLGKLMIWMTDDWKDMGRHQDRHFRRRKSTDAISKWEEICSANLDEAA